MQVYKTIKYIRLSYTDDKSVESDSVANQRKLIENFIERNPDIQIVSEKIARNRRGARRQAAFGFSSSGSKNERARSYRLCGSP